MRGPWVDAASAVGILLLAAAWLLLMPVHDGQDEDAPRTTDIAATP